jgi:hypothetical protein
MLAQRFGFWRGPFAVGCRPEFGLPPMLSKKGLRDGLNNELQKYRKFRLNSYPRHVLKIAISKGRISRAQSDQNPQNQIARHSCTQPNPYSCDPGNAKAITAFRKWALLKIRLPNIELILRRRKHSIPLRLTGKKSRSNIKDENYGQNIFGNLQHFFRR